MTEASATTEPLLRLEGVGMRFGPQEVLRDINLSIQRGQTAVIIGESGCGKTVLLKLIIALLRPTQGRVLFDGKALSELSERALTGVRLRFGFLFQGAALFDSLNVFDNVAFALREHTRKRKEEMEAIVGQRLAEVGLPAGIVDKKPAELSGGMKKRVGLARALVLNPEVMLYDEPTTGLDPIMTDVINELIVQTRRQRVAQHPVTSVIVTHEMRTVHKVADRVIMLYPLGRLKAGEPQIIFDGSVEELKRCGDARVTQFVQGEARERLSEMLNGSHRPVSDAGEVPFSDAPQSHAQENP